MTDIAFGEHGKKILHLVLRTGLKHLKLEEKVVEENLSVTTNPVVRYLNNELLNGASKIKPKWQRWMIRRYGQIALWILAKDTAYRDVFFWILYRVLKNTNKLLPLLEPYVKPPEEWTPNLWHDSKLKTEKLKKEGKIPVNSKSLDESVYVRSIQDNRAKKNLKRR